MEIQTMPLTNSEIKILDRKAEDSSNNLVVIIAILIFFVLFVTVITISNYKTSAAVLFLFLAIYAISVLYYLVNATTYEPIKSDIKKGVKKIFIGEITDKYDGGTDSPTYFLVLETKSFIVTTRIYQYFQIGQEIEIHVAPESEIIFDVKLRDTMIQDSLSK